jgi:hypothetical protein
MPCVQLQEYMEDFINIPVPVAVDIILEHALTVIIAKINI